MTAATKIFGRFMMFCLFCKSQVLSQECISPLGMENGGIKNMQISTSGAAKEAFGWQARLNKTILPFGAWCAYINNGSRAEKNYDQYIEIDLLKLTNITGIATQGREHRMGIEYVKDYKISFSKDSLNWIFYKIETLHEDKIFQGNTDVTSVKRHTLNPTIIAKYIRVHPGYDLGVNACMRLELYGCLVEKVILSYTMPLGQVTKSGKVEYKDTSYTGVITNDFYKDGTGILTDGKFGPVDVKSRKGQGWVGWNVTKIGFIDIIFEFSDMRKFKDVTLTINVDKKRCNAAFSKSQIFFASTKNAFSDTSFLQYCQKGYQAQGNPYNANVTLPLCENTARFIRLRLHFGGMWLLVTEISFNSVSAIKMEKKFLHCSDNTPHDCAVTSTDTSASIVTPSRRIPIQTNTPPTSECEEITNSVAMCFVGAAVTLLIEVLVAFGIRIYKRRYQASKLSTNGLKGDSVKMQSQIPPSHPAETQHKILELGIVRPAGGEASPYENVQISPYEDVQVLPSSAYTELNRNGRETTDNSGYQKLMKQFSGHEIPADEETGDYEEVGRLGKSR